MTSSFLAPRVVPLERLFISGRFRVLIRFQEQNSLFRATCALVVVCLVSQYSCLLYMFSTHSDNHRYISLQLSLSCLLFSKRIA